jgi:hypothetical protein
MKRHVTLRETTVVRKARPIPFTSVGEDHLAIDAEAGYCWALDRVGVRIWELLDTPTSVSALCLRLRQEYDVDEATCRRDVTDLLSTFVEEGLVLASDD